MRADAAIGGQRIDALEAQLVNARAAAIEECGTAVKALHAVKEKEFGVRASLHGERDYLEGIEAAAAAIRALKDGRG